MNFNPTYFYPRSGSTVVDLRVSIIITCYNYGRFVADAINSALSQTYANTEVIVVNDGSTDHSHDVISQYGDRITYINQPNSGVATARNNAISIATGEYCMCLDADDWLAPECVSAAVKLITDDCTIVSPIAFFTDHQLNIQKNIEPWPNEQTIKTNKNTVKSLLLGNRAVCCSLFPRHKWQQVGGYDTICSIEDYALWIDLVAAGCKIVYLDRNTVYMKYRQHGPSRTNWLDYNDQIDYTYIKHGVFDPNWGHEQKIQALYQFVSERVINQKTLRHFLNSNLTMYEIFKILRKIYIKRLY
jgi:glycosyltransferase involved in cell wall biosynthesis